ncbi:LuxR C-terminal-related transcriptional regulator [Allosphingosinicella deserti]|uniref:HTH luxR-type domain-containing protein n=1 Tax=Allosphingosinicella deserti TaxID=2116704 RepID=A0A2P7QED2_9SPHN|nr:LuxR C-terminal-related transcriptional regulator [Sphingomonas deserti]PSJ36333.1 hypothetical protein C7I55_26975 [Sphingomonas deserti]
MDGDQVGGIEALEARSRRAAVRLSALTDRQRQVLRFMVSDMRNKQIGQMLGIDEKTVKMHRAGILKRLGVGTAGAIRLAVEARYSICFDPTEELSGSLQKNEEVEEASLAGSEQGHWAQRGR